MAYKPLRMDTIELIKQYSSLGYSKRKISRLLGLSRNTVKKYLSKSSEEVKDDSYRDKVLQKLFPKITSELGRVGVTRWLLWEEYIANHPDGFSYSRFCRKLAAYKKKQDVTIRLEHRAGEVMSVDFAGKKMPWTDKSGLIHYAEVLVCSLPFSGYTFAIALPDQKQEHFVEGINSALLYFGGLPKVIQSDNLKSFVIKADRYEPTFNQLCIQLSSYYGVELSATRVGKPKDKASVERHVAIVYNKLYAPLRDEQFSNINQINQAFSQHLEKLNTTLMQGRSYSRKDRFEEDEKPHLSDLPPAMFEVKKSTRAKVQRNYHVILGEDWHQYSVPFTYVGKQCEIEYTNSQVEIYCGTERIAVHRRDRRKQGYSSFAAHMPEKHRKYLEQRGWDATYFKKQSAKIGPNTFWAMEQILESKRLIEQTYNTCLGVLRLSKKYGPQRLEAACMKARTTHRINYQILSNILKNNMDQLEPDPQRKLFSIQTHENIRGSDYYG